MFIYLIYLFYLSICFECQVGESWVNADCTVNSTCVSPREIARSTPIVCPPTTTTTVAHFTTGPAVTGSTTGATQSTLQLRTGTTKETRTSQTQTPGTSGTSQSTVPASTQTSRTSGSSVTTTMILSRRRKKRAHIRAKRAWKAHFWTDISQRKFKRKCRWKLCNNFVLLLTHLRFSSLCTYRH